jgi:hypothetical protein
MLKGEEREVKGGYFVQFGRCGRKREGSFRMLF